MPSIKSKTTQQFKFQFDALGTPWEIQTFVELSKEIRSSVLSRLEQFDNAYSRFREDSLVKEMTQHSGKFTMPKDFNALFRVYEKCYDATNGLMTPLIGSVLEQAGYDSSYSLIPGDIAVPRPFTTETIVWDGVSVLETMQPLVLDFGAAGKGYAVDIVGALLGRNNVNEYTIDASGDILQSGTRSLRVGLEHPQDDSKIIGVAQVSNKSICASASNRRVWNGFHHIFNPETLLPVDDVIASWVVADTAIIADAVATALFFVQLPDTLIHEFQCSYVRMFKDGRVEQSNNFQGELFL